MRLVADRLKCMRGEREVFADVSFAAEAGKALAVTGPNGAGKSSLLRLIAGLLPVFGGQIMLEGADDDLSLAEQAHYLGHRDALKPSLSVMENLAFWRDFLGGGAGDPQDALASVGLDRLANLPAGFLSAGQRRRLSIARLLAVKRPLWLLDEPTSALDTAAQTALAEILQAHLAEGGLVIAATHMPLGVAAQEIRLGGTPSPIAEGTA